MGDMVGKMMGERREYIQLKTHLYGDHVTYLLPCNQGDMYWHMSEIGKRI